MFFKTKILPIRSRISEKAVRVRSSGRDRRRRRVLVLHTACTCILLNSLFVLFNRYIYSFNGLDGNAFFFPRRGNSDYVIIRGSMPNLSALTACLWMRAADTNPGTPLGYAVPGQDNEFIIYNYQSFMLFVGGEYRSVKMPMGYGMGRLLSEVADCPVWMMISTSPDKASKTALSFK